MKNKLLLLIISLLFLKVGFAQSNHIINIDGTNDGWSGLETFTNCSSADNAYFTWDADFIYFGIKDAEADYGNLATFIYLDIDPSGTNGSNSAYAWDNNITTPFNADWVIVWKNNPGADYIEIRKYVTGNWNQIASSTSTSLNYNSVEVVKFAIGSDYREVKIKRTIFDNPIAIKLASFTQQDYGSKWRYFAWPSNDWTDKANGSSQSIPNYYGFILKDQISQTNSPYYNADIKSFDGSTNGTGTDWSTPENWTSDALPSSSTLAIIPSGKTVNIASTSTADAYDLVVNGTLTIKSDATGTGSLKHNSNNVPATVERYIKAANWTDAQNGWHLLSSPVSSPNQSISGVWTPDGTSKNDYDFYALDESEPINSWKNQKVSENSITEFIPGSGYMVAYEETPLLPRTFAGFLTTSDVTLSGLSYTDNSPYPGFHLVGNPFACAINWNSGTWTKTNIDDNAYVWSEGAYVSTAAPGYNFIPATNGFMVRVNSSSGTLIIPADSRDHNIQNWYKSSQEMILLKANDLANNMTQTSIVRFNSQATTGYDTEFDSYFVKGYAPTFYSSSEGNKLLLNTLPLINESLQIPFTFVKNNSENFSIELQQNIDGFTPYLEDLKTNTIQNLTENPIYTFTSEAGDDPNRFELRFMTPTGLEKTSTKSSLRVYTTNGKINISGVDGKAEVYVRNIVGQVFLRNSVNGSTLQSFNTSNLPAGIYMVSVVSATKTVSQKVVVK